MKRLARGAGRVAALAVASCCLHCSVQEPPPEQIVRRDNPVSLSESVLRHAKGNYEQYCSECHGAGGKGNGAMSGMLRKEPADLTDGAVLGAVTDGEIYWAITKGKRPAMPPLEGKLAAEERWGLVHLLRRMSNTQPNSSPRTHR